MTASDFWKLMAGLGLFLYGMFHLEDSIKQIDGRGFKLFLQKHTQNKLSGIFSGTLVTAVMQSSSIVNLMVLSFVGAEMLSMRNALAVVLGTNIGGTFNSWLVALLGFKTDIGKFALPIIALAGVGLIIFRNRKKGYNIVKFLIGLGLLFLGLNFMKESMDSLIKEFDFTPYLGYSKIVFVLIGFVITALIQTSAATVVIVLSAIYAKIIPVETAVAIVLGAELGTTLKLLIGAIGGIAAKKRIALGNITFNFTTTLFGFLLLVPIVKLIRDVIGINDPIIILVFFQTSINIVGVILFYFALDYFGKLLETVFIAKDKSVTRFIQNANPAIFETSIELLEKEVGLFIYRTIQLNMEGFKIDNEFNINNEFSEPDDEKNLYSISLPYDDKYNLIKQAEGEIVSFYSKMAMQEITSENRRHLNQLIAAVRNAVYSAKGMKDIIQNRKEFSNSVNEIKYDCYELFRLKLKTFYVEITKILIDNDKSLCNQKLSKLLSELKTEYDDILKKSYKDAEKDTLKDVDVSTLFNVNREIYSSCKAIIFSLKDYLLDTNSSEKFDDTATVSSNY